MNATGMGGKTTRRSVLWLLAAAAPPLTPAACGPRGSSGNGPASGRGQPSGQIAGKLAFWAINAPWGQMGAGIGAEQLNTFRARYPALQLEVEDVVPGGAASIEKLHTAAAAGTLPDLYMANRGYAAQLGAEGLSRPLDAYLKQSKALPRDDLWESHLQDASWKGRVFAVTHSSGVWVLFLNQQLWQEAGLSVERPPKTWAELEDAARRTARVSGGVVERAGYHPTWGNAGPSLWLVHYRQLGGDYFTKDWQPAFASDERAIQALTWMKGFIDRQGGAQALDEFRSQIQAIGRAGGVFASHRIATLIDSHTIITDLERSVPDLSFTVAALPLPPRGRQSGWQGGADLHIARESKAADAAWAVIEHLMAPENILAFSLALSRIPSRRSVGQSKAYLDRSPHHRTFIDMVPHSHNVPAIPGNADLAPIIAGVTGDVLAGRKGVREALQDAAQKTAVVVDKWRRYLE
jgi:multiple sugar transport system substrate-binding protein